MPRTSGSKNLTPEVDKIIFDLAWKSRSNKGRRNARKGISNLIKQEIKTLKLICPSDDYLKREISRIWNHAADPKDSPWSLVALPDNPIPSEAVPYVLKVWAYTLMASFNSPLTKKVEKISPLTIREAVWVGRLYSIFRANALGSLDDSSQVGEPEGPLTLSVYQYQEKLNHILNSLPADMETIEALWAFASTLAINEKRLQDSGKYPDTMEEMLSFWLNDAEVYGILPEGEPSAGKLQTQLTQEYTVKRYPDYRRKLDEKRQATEPTTIDANLLKPRGRRRQSIS